MNLNWKPLSVLIVALAALSLTGVACSGKSKKGKKTPVTINTQDRGSERNSPPSDRPGRHGQNPGAVEDASNRNSDPRPGSVIGNKDKSSGIIPVFIPDPGTPVPARTSQPAPQDQTAPSEETPKHLFKRCRQIVKEEDGKITSLNLYQCLAAKILDQRNIEAESFCVGGDEDKVIRRLFSCVYQDENRINEYANAYINKYNEKDGRNYADGNEAYLLWIEMAEIMVMLRERKRPEDGGASHGFALNVVGEKKDKRINEGALGNAHNFIDDDGKVPDPRRFMDYLSCLEDRNQKATSKENVMEAMDLATKDKKSGDNSLRKLIGSPLCPQVE